MRGFLGDDDKVQFVPDRDGDRDRVSLSLIQPGGANAPRMILRISSLNNDADAAFFQGERNNLGAGLSDEFQEPSDEQEIR